MSGQRDRVLQLRYMPKGEKYVNIERALLLDANGEQAFFVEKMERLQVVQDRLAAHGLIGRPPAFQHMLALIDTRGARAGHGAAAGRVRYWLGTGCPGNSCGQPARSPSARGGELLQHAVKPV